LEYIHDLKGVTVYVDGSRKDQPISHVTEKEAKEHLEKDNVKSTMDEAVVKCHDGYCEM